MKSKKTQVGMGAALGAVVVCGGAIGFGFTSPAGMASAWAQQANPYGPQVQRIFDELSTKLNLTATQKREIAAMLREAAPEGRAIHENSKLTPQQKQARLQSLRKATQQKIARVLTAKQREQAKQFFANRRQIAQNTFQRVADELELTPQQRTKARPIMQKAIQEGQSISQDFSLPLSTKRSRLIALQQKTLKELNPILTPQQQQKFVKMREAVKTEMMARFLANREAIRGMK